MTGNIKRINPLEATDWMVACAFPITEDSDESCPVSCVFYCPGQPNNKSCAHPYQDCFGCFRKDGMEVVFRDAYFHWPRNESGQEVRDE